MCKFLKNLFGGKGNKAAENPGNLAMAINKLFVEVERMDEEDKVYFSDIDRIKKLVRTVHPSRLAEIENFIRQALVHINTGNNESAVTFYFKIMDGVFDGQADASKEDVELAMQTACADEFILTKEGGLAYEASFGGSNLSGGQKQRLNAARAFARKAGLLILDDASSALDNATDKKMRRAIKEHKQNADRTEKEIFGIFGVINTIKITNGKSQ